MRGLRPYREVLPPSMEHLLNFALAHYLHANRFSQPHPAMEAASPATWPLRYRIVDRVNQQIKRSSWAHRAARSLIVGLVKFKREGTRQLQAMRSRWWPRTRSATLTRSLRTKRSSPASPF